MTDYGTSMAALHIDPANLDSRQNYFLLTSVVVPRPIAWVSTVDTDGMRNLAPHSYFNLASTDPPIVLFSSIGVKDTLRNIELSGGFVINVVSHELVEKMNLTSAGFPPEEDEFSWSRLEAIPSERVQAPRVALAKVALECLLLEVRPMGNGNVVFGRVVLVHVADAVWRDGRVDPTLLKPVGRLGGTAYATAGDIYRLPRPRWDETRRDLDFPDQPPPDM